MSDTITMKIEIPADNDGFALLQCSLCGELFKVKPSDYEDDGVLEIHCPACGLSGENFFTEEVIELALAMAQNYAHDLIYSQMKKWEKQLSNGIMTFKAGKKPKPEYESPIHATIDALTITRFRCCGYDTKIKPLLKICGSYCPFCGVKEFELE